MSMIVFFEELAAIDGVKICVSSRPWVIYKDAFLSCPQLRLEELTKGDISIYVHDHLSSSKLFQLQQQRHPKLLTNIADEIILKANCVFLWVRLVVQELLKRVRDGAFAAELLKQLRGIPPDLDDYFIRMMETIDPRYRQDAATMLQIALYNMDFTLDQSTPESKQTAGPDLLLLQFRYLDEEEAPNFVISENFSPLRYDDDDEVSYWIETLDRRLTSRCMGLLKANKILPGQSRWQTKVGFLHRTARDFMCTREAQIILQKYTNGPYDAHTYRRNLLVADVMSLHQSFSTESRRLASALDVACFLAQMQLPSTIHKPSSFALYEMLAVYIETTIREARNQDEFGKAIFIEPRFDQIAQELLSDYKIWDDLPVNLATKIGWEDYVQSKKSARLEDLESLMNNSSALRLGTAPSLPGYSDAFFSARSSMFREGIDSI